MTDETRVHRDSITLVDRGNLVIVCHGQSFVVQRADRWDLLLALMEIQGVEQDVIKLVTPNY